MESMLYEKGHGASDLVPEEGPNDTFSNYKRKGRADLGNQLVQNQNED